MSQYSINEAFVPISKLIDENEKILRSKLSTSVLDDDWNCVENSFNEISIKMKHIDIWRKQLSDLMKDMLSSGVFDLEDYNGMTTDLNNSSYDNDSSVLLENGYRRVFLGFDLNNERVCGFMFEGYKYMDCDMTACFIKMCEILYTRNKMKFYMVMNSDFTKGERYDYISTSPDLPALQEARDVKNCYHKLNVNSNGLELYVWTCINNKTKTRILQQMLTIYGIDHKKLSFYII